MRFLNSAGDDWNIEALAAVDGIILECLPKLTGEWARQNPQDLSSDELWVMSRLVAAGLAELRLTVTANGKTTPSQTIVCEVSGGFASRLAERIKSELNCDGILCLDANPIPDIRLTAQGLQAQNDIQSPERIHVGHALAYTRGFTPFTGGHIAEGVVRIAQKKSVEANAVAGRNGGRRVISDEERGQIEDKGAKILSRHPTISRDDFAARLGVSGGIASGLKCWTERPKVVLAKSKSGKKPSGKRIGLDIAIERANKPTYSSVKDQQAELAQLVDEQEADAKLDGIELDSPS